MKKSFPCCIIVLDKGFVYHGDLEVAEDGWFTITNCKNIRAFGSTKGLGQLSLNGPADETVLDPTNTVVGSGHVLQHVIMCNPAKWVGK